MITVFEQKTYHPPEGTRSAYTHIKQVRVEEETGKVFCEIYSRGARGRVSANFNHWFTAEEFGQIAKKVAEIVS